ncbi:MAG: recombinase family protein [Alphaproteobacteria bacterium]|nr:recombinase family protein [Alphaproteobacteria bacterium]
MIKRSTGQHSYRSGLEGLIRQDQGTHHRSDRDGSPDRMSRAHLDTLKIYRCAEYHRVAMITLIEGKITPLQVGLKGMMNELFLETQRHQIKRAHEGRVREGQIFSKAIDQRHVMAWWSRARKKLIPNRPKLLSGFSHSLRRRTFLRLHCPDVQC